MSIQCKWNTAVYPYFKCIMEEIDLSPIIWEANPLKQSFLWENILRVSNNQSTNELLDVNVYNFTVIWFNLKPSCSSYQSCNIYFVTSLEKSMKTKQNYWQLHYYLRFLVCDLNKIFFIYHIIDSFSNKTRGNSLYCTCYNLSYYILKFIFVHSKAGIC